MAAYTYTIELTSDAEPGSGLGSELINSLVPRNHWRKPVIQASHIKGLMREALREMAAPLGWPHTLEARVFGLRDEGRPGIDAVIRLTDAVATTIPERSFVTRTSVEQQTGVAKDTSLRTTESIPLGTVFIGEIFSAAEPGSVEELAWRLALLTIPAVGASRNRGCGACIVNIAGTTETPGELLQTLHQHLDTWDNETVSVEKTAPAGVTSSPAATQPVVLRLAFYAKMPVCCPEVADKTNVLKSGFSIPASAVQGVILNRLNASDPELATAVFASEQFRPWPLLPCWAPASADAPWPNSAPVPIRVSLTHRVAKFSTGKTFQAGDFFDSAIETTYDWTRPGGGAPMKTADGVLLRDHGTVRLWKGSDMPRVMTAHGVRNDPSTPDGRNLFTVDAMAPMLWQGVVVMPADAALRLQDSLAADPIVAFGKSRSVRGIGTLRATRCDDAVPEWQPLQQSDHTVLVVQSPLLLPDVASPSPNQHAEQALRTLAEAWARQHGLIDTGETVRSWANVGMHFGWNRHASTHGASGRQAACRVILPGSVIKLNKRVDAERLPQALMAGVGSGRQRGFGAVSVHPGMATALYEHAIQPQPVPVQQQLQDAIKLVLDMRRSASRLPSPSQIRAVQHQLGGPGGQDAVRYLQQQTERTSRIWFTWEPIHAQMDELLKNYDAHVASRALDVLANLAIVDQQQGEPA
jgi:hypothetical protein